MSTVLNPPLIPWYPCNFPKEIVWELTRREGLRGLSYTTATQGMWENQIGNWSKYKGPQTPFVRLTSNGYGSESNPSLIAPGFILASPADFFNTYGFNKSNNSNESIIGFQPDSTFTPHTILNSKHSAYPIHVLSPQIESINITIQQELYRRATINWVCFSKAQLEYMTPYFLVPGISMFLEWGWNNYNVNKLINITDPVKLKAWIKNPYPLYTDYILQSNGNYDVMIGTVTNFEWSVDGNKFKCMTEISSRDRMYAGLVLSSTTGYTPLNINGEETDSDASSKLPFGNLVTFVDKQLDLFKSVIDKTGKLHNIISSLSNNKQSNTSKNIISKELHLTPDELTVLNFVKYIIQNRPNNWKEYVYGVFYGRDTNAANDTIDPNNKRTDDFDIKSPQKNIWINLGLIIDLFNYCNKSLSTISMGEMFRVDIDDIIITGHINMISCDGSVLLIPNKMAPKYFYGGAIQINNISPDDMEKMKVSSTFNASLGKNKSLSDKRLKFVCLQIGGTYRDDLDELINTGRYSNGGVINTTVEFPSSSASFKSGYLKNLYINTNYLKSLVHDESVKTYTDLINKMMSDISVACGNFWDFRLVSAIGNPFSDGNQATMKIIDTKYVPDNLGIPYIFEYMTDNSILTNIEFKPTISNAQAIKTIYASSNIKKNSDTSLNNGTTELLDYKFRDRLFLDESIKNADQVKNTQTTDDGRSLVNSLQTISATPEMYQITAKSNTTGQVIIRRLALPAPDVLNLLLDDGDYDNNPTYVGIMPGIQATFTLQGIGGLRTYMMFRIRGLPEPYSENNIIFRIIDIKETIESGKWFTTITAGVIPLRNGIRVKLGLPPE